MVDGGGGYGPETSPFELCLKVCAKFRTNLSQTFNELSVTFTNFKNITKNGPPVIIVKKTILKTKRGLLLKRTTLQPRIRYEIPRNISNKFLISRNSLSLENVVIQKRSFLIKTLEISENYSRLFR